MKKKTYRDILKIFVVALLLIMVNIINIQNNNVQARVEEGAGGAGASSGSSGGSNGGGGGSNPTPTPTPCPAGEAGSPGNCSACSGVLEYTSSAGNASCSSCNDGEVANSSHTGCVTAPVTGLSNPGSSAVYLALNESSSLTKNLTASTYSGAKLGTVNWSGPGAGFSLSGSNTKKTLTFTGRGSGTWRYNVTASAGGGSATASGSYQRYNCDWSEKSVDVVYKSTKPAYARHLSSAGCDFYDAAGTITNSKGQTGYRYTGFHSRCCHSSPPPSDFGGCYGDEPYRGIATEVGWSRLDQAFTKNGKNLKYRYDDIENEGACTTMAAGKTCEKNKSIPQVVEKEAVVCEDNVDFQVDSVASTCAGDDSFYTISCIRDVNTNFDYGDDEVSNTSNKLLNGQGFGFLINVGTKVTCRATFNPTPWKESYNRIMERLKTVKSRRNTSFTKTAYQAYQENDDKKWEEYISKLQSYDDVGNDKYTKDTISYLYEEHRLARDLENIVKNYNNYSFDEEFNEATSLSMEYKIEGEKKKFDYTFTNTINDDGGKKEYTSSAYNLGVSWLENPRNYKWVKNRNVKLYPENSYLKRSTGQEDSESTEVDGGNKIYLDYKTDTPQTIEPITITVTGLAGNNSKVTNSKCSIVVDKEDYSYRPIDVSNPFINSKWEKGKNWVNEMYDFTKTIHATTWSESTRNTINLSTEDISSIKESNKKNADDFPYLGLCDTIKSSNQDSITKKLCNMIK